MFLHPHEKEKCLICENTSKRSGVAQWWSIRLLTGGLLVRV